MTSPSPKHGTCSGLQIEAADFVHEGDRPREVLSLPLSQVLSIISMPSHNASYLQGSKSTQNQMAISYKVSSLVCNWSFSGCISTTCFTARGKQSHHGHSGAQHNTLQHTTSGGSASSRHFKFSPTQTSSRARALPWGLSPFQQNHAARARAGPSFPTHAAAPRPNSPAQALGGKSRCHTTTRSRSLHHLHWPDKRRPKHHRCFPPCLLFPFILDAAALWRFYSASATAKTQKIPRGWLQPAKTSIGKTEY